MQRIPPHRWAEIDAIQSSQSFLTSVVAGRRVTDVLTETLTGVARPLGGEGLQNLPDDARILLVAAAPLLTEATLHRLLDAPGEIVVLEGNPGDDPAATPELRRFASRAVGSAAAAASVGRLRDHQPPFLASLAGHMDAVFIAPGRPLETLVITNEASLSAAHTELVMRHVESLLERGVRILRPFAVEIDMTVEIGEGTVIEPFVTLRGATRIGRNCTIASGAVLQNVIVGEEVTIGNGTVAEDSVIGDRATVGPMAHLRIGSHLAHHVRIGNFVEVKQSTLGPRSTAKHLTYIGDAEVGSGVNFGAGTILCNYDGAAHHRTIIDDDAFIGSDSQLVAPVTIGRGAFVGAGSTIVRDVPPDALALSRAGQTIVPDWVQRKRPRKA